MSDPTLLYCVGATKAGTSWLYRQLHDHAECRLPAVKEAHYWDTFDADVCDKQLVAFRRNLANLHRQRADAATAGRGWQVANLDRRIADMSGLIDVLDGDRDNDLGYATWLAGNAGQARLVADMTPNYGLLPGQMLRRMMAISATTRVVFLVRDPLARLWSHVRMQAERQLGPDQTFTEKANATLWRILNNNQETHIAARGNYAKIAKRLTNIVPASRLLIMFTETLFTPKGWQQICAFLGLTHQPAQEERRVHAGPTATMRDDLLEPALHFLKDQYDWAAQTMGTLPANWQENRARIAA